MVLLEQIVLMGSGIAANEAIAGECEEFCAVVYRVLDGAAERNVANCFDRISDC